MGDLVEPLVKGLVTVLAAAAVVEAGVSFLTRAPADVDKAVD